MFSLAQARRGLPKLHRLLRPAEFKATLKSSLRWRDNNFGVYVLPNACTYGRLGIIVSRKSSPRAVDRNRVKRQIREMFRQHQENLTGLDIVVVANPNIGKAANQVLCVSLREMWKKIEGQCKNR